MKKKELKKAYEEGIISEETYKEKLFEIETTPKIKVQKRKFPVCISQEEFIKIVQNTKQKKYKLAFYLGWMSGLRISEVVSVPKPSQEQLNEKKLLIKDAKGGKDRTVPLPKGFKKEYIKLMPLQDFFKNKKSAIRSIQIAFKRAAKNAGILEHKPSAHFHSLRHGFATHALNIGMPIHHVRTLLGHTNISTTNIYLEANPKKALEDYQELF